MRLIPAYFGFTAAILALFITIEAPGSDLDALGAGTAVGIILGVFAGVTAICYIFFVPFFERKLIKKDARLRIWHIPLGPLLRRDSISLYLPGNGTEYVTDYYADAYGNVAAGEKPSLQVVDHVDQEAMTPHSSEYNDKDGSDTQSAKAAVDTGLADEQPVPRYMSPYKRWIKPVEQLSWFNPRKSFNWLKFLLCRGVTIDVITHDSALLRSIHAKANRYDVRVEHLWTYCQVMSAILMSIAHGSNDIANAVGPLAAVYATYNSGGVNTESPTPVWILVIGGLMLGFGFWFMGYHIIRALGNKITQMSPTRGYAIELGAATTVLMASRLGLPVSTTQCLTGAAVGVALMNYDLGAVNWRQVAFIFMGWVLTLPAAGLIAGLLCVMALNAPSF